MQIDLTGKKIIVTGASSGIGYEIASSLIKSGATVAIHCNSNTEAADTLLKTDNASKVFKANLSIESETVSFFQEVVDYYGKIDMIIHNAGIFKEHSTSQTLDEWMDIWHSSMNLNLHSVGLLTYLGIKHFKDHGGGRMVYIASRAAFKGETQDYMAYAASKGAVVSLARTVARSFGVDKIKSFIIAPGFTKTPMAADFIAKNGEQGIIQESAIKEITKPEHISPLITLIAAGLMDHATGSTIDFNAGSYIH